MGFPDVDEKKDTEEWDEDMLIVVLVKKLSNKRI